MMKPNEIPERTPPGDYVNRVKQTDHGHRPVPRDFAYEIREAAHEEEHRHPSPEFGQDTYESSEDEKKPSEEGEKQKSSNRPEPTEDGGLDIVV
jgi:hypothetical protein